jgi:uncharacterized protein (TIGR02611 family)
VSSEPVKPEVSEAGADAGSQDGSGAGGAAKRGRAAKMAESLHERRERHVQRSRPYRAAIVLVGFVVVLAGIVLSGPGVPGPGFLVILIGLAILALEFDWAESLMNRALAYADRAGDRASDMSTRSKVLTTLFAAAAAAAFIAAAIAWDIPVLPV